MGFLSWFCDFGFLWKILVGIFGGVVVVISVYGLYIFYVYLKDCKGEFFDGDIVGEILEKKILVLGLEGVGKSIFFVVLVQYDSLIIFEWEVIKFMEGFYVVCVLIEGISLNIWESEYYFFIFNI